MVAGAQHLAFLMSRRIRRLVPSLNPRYSPRGKDRQSLAKDRRRGAAKDRRGRVEKKVAKAVIIGPVSRSHHGSTDTADTRLVSRDDGLAENYCRVISYLSSASPITAQFIPDRRIYRISETPPTMSWKI